MKLVPRLLSTALIVVAIFGAAGATAFSFTPPAEVEGLRKKISLIGPANKTKPVPSAKATDTTKSVVEEGKAPSPTGSEAAKSIEEETKAAPSAKGSESVEWVVEESKLSSLNKGR